MVRTVLLYGSSLQMAGLQASLSAVLGLHVHQVRTSEGKLMECVRVAAPDFIVFELGALSDQTAYTLLTEFPGIDLVGIDLESNRLLVLSVRQQTAPDTSDLVRMIQEKGVVA